MNESSCSIGSRREHERDNDKDVPLTHFYKKPLYIWVKSFSDKESPKDDENLSAFVTGNALEYALEYVGISSESEQSSLHLSAIFDEFEESQQQSRNKFPNHYESETKNRIQNLNRMFNELKAHFDDHFSQLVALKPPNSVHIVSACQSCSVQELEKLIFLLLGAAIQGSQKQDTIKKIKRFPVDVQEALIEHIKLIQDNPDILHIKSWTEFNNLEVEERQKIYESLLSLIRRLLFERNQAVQTQLMSDYFSGYMYCGQRRIYEGKSFGPESEYEDARFNGALRQLKEELHEKSDLLQECREELEISKNHAHELQSQLMELQQQLKSCKKARDELDALREGQDKALRLEAELQRMKKKLQDSEQYFERVEVLEVENRSLLEQNESLLEQNSFLTIEKESLKMMISSDSILDISNNSYTEKNTLEISDILNDDESKEFSVELEDVHHELPLEDTKDCLENEENKQGDTIKDEEERSKSKVCIQENDDNDAEQDHGDEIDCADVIEGTTEYVDLKEDGQIANSLTKKQEGSTDKRTKRRRRRSSLINVKRTRRTILFPLRGAQKLLPVVLSDIGNHENSGENRSVAIKVIKVCHAPSSKRKCCSHAKNNRRSKSLRRRQQGNKQLVTPDMENDADEELSMSPNGPPNFSDIENFENPKISEERNNDSDVYFMCSSSAKTIGINQEEVEEEELGREYVEKTFPINGNVTCTTTTSMNNHNNVPVKLSNGSHCISTMEVPHHHLTQELLSINTKNIEINYDDPSDVEKEHCMCHNCVTGKVVGMDKEILSGDPLINPRICVNVNAVENYSTHINLNLNNIVQYEGTTNEFSRINNNNNNIGFQNGLLLSKHNNENILTGHEGSSSEDDESLWYEYGCV